MGYKLPGREKYTCRIHGGDDTVTFEVSCSVEQFDYIYGLFVKINAARTTEFSPSATIDGYLEVPALSKKKKTDTIPFVFRVGRGDHYFSFAKHYDRKEVSIVIDFCRSLNAASPSNHCATIEIPHEYYEQCEGGDQ